jgi:hypothetical protein
MDWKKGSGTGEKVIGEGSSGEVLAEPIDIKLERS